MFIKTWVTPYAFVRICIYIYVYAYAIVYVPILSTDVSGNQQPAFGGNLHTLESVNANASKSRDTVEGTLKEA